jgi:hypothetical protein
MSIETLKKNLLTAYNSCNKSKKEHLIKFHGFKNSSEFLRFLKTEKQLKNK